MVQSVVVMMMMFYGRRVWSRRVMMSGPVTSTDLALNSILTCTHATAICSLIIPLYTMKLVRASMSQDGTTNARRALIELVAISNMFDNSSNALIKHASSQLYACLM